MKTRTAFSSLANIELKVRWPEKSAVECDAYNGSYLLFVRADNPKKIVAKVNADDFFDEHGNYFDMDDA